MSARPLKVIQVGSGGMGVVWLDLLTSSADVDLVGLIDLDLDLAASALRERGLEGIPRARSITELLVSVHADAVVNVTVPAAHHAVNIEAMFAGLPVLCEKPIAPTVAQAISLAAASESSGMLLMTSQSRRYYRSIARFRQLVSTLGAVGSITSEFFLAPRFGGFRDEMKYPLLVDMAIHTFDAARYVLGAEPTSVYCESFNPAWSWYAGDASAMAIFEFDSGARFSYSGSWCSPGSETSWNGQWRVAAHDGSATWDGETATTVCYADTTRVAPATIDQDSPEVIAGALAEFISAVRDGATPSAEVHSNILSLAMVEAAVQSAESGLRVRIDDTLQSAWEEAVAHEGHDGIRETLLAWGSAQDGLAAWRSSHSG